MMHRQMCIHFEELDRDDVMFNVFMYGSNDVNRDKPHDYAEPATYLGR